MVPVKQKNERSYQSPGVGLFFFLQKRKQKAHNRPAPHYVQMCYCVTKSGEFQNVKSNFILYLFEKHKRRVTSFYHTKITMILKINTQEHR